MFLKSHLACHVLDHYVVKMFCFSSSFLRYDWKNLHSSVLHISRQRYISLYIYIGHSPVKSRAIKCEQGLDKSYYLIIWRSLIVVVFLVITYYNYCFPSLNSTTTIAITATATITTAAATVYYYLLQRTLLKATRKRNRSKNKQEKWISFVHWVEKKLDSLHIK